MRNIKNKSPRRRKGEDIEIIFVLKDIIGPIYVIQIVCRDRRILTLIEKASFEDEKIRLEYARDILGNSHKIKPFKNLPEILK